MGVSNSTTWSKTYKTWALRRFKVIWLRDTLQKVSEPTRHSRRNVLPNQHRDTERPAGALRLRRDGAPQHAARSLHLRAGVDPGHRRALLRAHPAKEALHTRDVPRQSPHAPSTAREEPGEALVGGPVPGGALAGLHRGALRGDAAGRRRRTGEWLPGIRPHVSGGEGRLSHRNSTRPRLNTQLRGRRLTWRADGPHRPLLWAPGEGGERPVRAAGQRRREELRGGFAHVPQTWQRQVELLPACQGSNFQPSRGWSPGQLPESTDAPCAAKPGRSADVSRPAAPTERRWAAWDGTPQKQTTVNNYNLKLELKKTWTFVYVWQKKMITNVLMH